MGTEPISFPKTIPSGVKGLASEPAFGPSVHLQLELSTGKVRLSDLGYTADEIGRCPSDVAFAGPFRMLSDEGAAALLDIARRLKAFAQSSERIQSMVRYPAYRSHFIRDLSLSGRSRRSPTSRPAT